MLPKKKVKASKLKLDANKQYRNLDYFTSKNIQDENEKITKIFQKES